MKAYLESKSNEEESQDESTLLEALDKAWKDIHSGHANDTLLRDYFSLCALVLAKSLFNAFKKDASIAITSKSTDNIRFELDRALIIGTDLFRADVMEMVVSLSPPIDLNAPIGQDALFLRNRIPNPPSLSLSPVPRPQSMSLFGFNSASTPFIISGAIAHWPALSSPQRMWNRRSYLKSHIGHRTLPVEVGKTYLEDNWRLELIRGSEYLDCYVERPQPNKMAYLAQVKLFDHVPSLRDDIYIPDLALAQADEDDIHINAWFGPSDTVTPCHHDPYDNLLCQVFGSKYIRLYAPTESHKMYPHQKGALSNASMVDVMVPDLDAFPLHYDANYQDCVLSEGEMLYIPHGWWHYVRSLETSFSVSFWWPPV